MRLNANILRGLPNLYLYIEKLSTKLYPPYQFMKIIILIAF